MSRSEIGGSAQSDLPATAVPVMTLIGAVLRVCSSRLGGSAVDEVEAVGEDILQD